MKYFEKNPVLRKDLEYINENTDTAPFNEKTVLISGASGFLGSILTKSLLCSRNDTNVIALVRNGEKAKKIFENADPKNLKIVAQNIKKPLNLEYKADYIIHTASVTSSFDYINNPIETITTMLQGTENLLKYAQDCNAKGFLFVSSVEVYGAHAGNEKIAEDTCSTIDTMSPRSSYPEAKRMCENLCAAYAKEYKLRTMSARLTQTFGPGMDFNDSRVIGQFIRSIIEKKDIILHTDGSSSKSYCYSADAVTALLTILTKGSASNAYNVANPATYASIKDIAHSLCEKYPDSHLKFQNNDTSLYFPKTLMNFDTQKLQNLGWKPKFSLDEMFERTFEYFKGESDER